MILMCFICVCHVIRCSNYIRGFNAKAALFMSQQCGLCFWSRVQEKAVTDDCLHIIVQNYISFTWQGKFFIFQTGPFCWNHHLSRSFFYNFLLYNNRSIPSHCQCLTLHFHTALTAQPSTAGEQGNGQIIHNYLVMLVRDYVCVCMSVA